MNPGCTRRIEHPHHLVRQSWGHENDTAIEVGVCAACHEAQRKGQLRFDWDGPRPNANARAGQPGYVRPVWVGASNQYRPMATGYRRPDAIRGLPGKAGRWPEDAAGDDGADE